MTNGWKFAGNLHVYGYHGGIWWEFNGVYKYLTSYLGVSENGYTEHQTTFVVVGVSRFIKKYHPILVPGDVSIPKHENKSHTHTHTILTPHFRRPSMGSHHPFSLKKSVPFSE